MTKLALTIVAVVAAVFMATTASATGPVFEDSGFPCGVLDGEGNTVATTDSHFILYASGKGVLHCEATGVSNPSGEIIRWNFENTGALCGTPFGGTDIWQNKVSRIGGSQLTCEIHVDLNEPTALSSSGSYGLG